MWSWPAAAVLIVDWVMVVVVGSPEVVSAAAADVAAAEAVAAAAVELFAALPVAEAAAAETESVAVEGSWVSNQCPVA